MMRHELKRRRRRLHRQLLAGVAFVGLLAGVVALPLAHETDAAWTDAEHGQATLTARVNPIPLTNIRVTTCTSPWLGGDPSYSVTWTVPQGYPQGTSTVWTAPAGVNQTVTPTHLGNGTYQINYSREQLGWAWATTVNRTFTLRMVVNGVSSPPRTLTVVRTGITGDPTCGIS